MHEEYLKLTKLFSLSKKNILSLENEISALSKEIEELKIKSKSLSSIDVSSSCPSSKYFEKQIEGLKNTLAKFTFGRDNLALFLVNKDVFLINLAKDIILRTKKFIKITLPPQNLLALHLLHAFVAVEKVKVYQLAI